MDAKINMRKRVLAQRDALDLEAQKSKSATICCAIEKHISASFPTPCIAVYEAIRSEVDVGKLVTAAYHRGWHVCFPCMVREAESNEAARMVFFHVPESLHAQASQTMLAHPLRCHTCEDIVNNGYIEVDPSEFDVVIVPLVAFDAQGNRLGYGGGNYDRLLSHLRPDTLVLGVAFTEQEVEALPLEPHDQQLSHIITA